MKDLDESRFRHPAMGRRRALFITGAAIGTTLGLGPTADVPGKIFRAPTRLHRWRGEVLGAQARILLHGFDENTARRLFLRCLDEVGRLEDIFSLYRPRSALARLNHDGHLINPPHELVTLLSESIRFANLTDGAFDVTVQALWKLYAKHFSHPNPDPAGPSKAERTRALTLVDYTAVDIDRRHIAFRHPGMAITLNGIAQGYITDSIVALLRRSGVNDVFVDLGETRALGRHSSGRPWTIGVVDPNQPEKLAHAVTIRDEAVASSGGYGTRFDSSGRNHHLFDRFSGTSAMYNLGVTVIAPTATTADALSTALSVMPYDRALICLDHFNDAKAIITLLDGTVVMKRSSRSI